MSNPTYCRWSGNAKTNKICEIKVLCHTRGIYIGHHMLAKTIKRQVYVFDIFPKWSNEDLPLKNFQEQRNDKKKFYIFQLARVFLHYLKSLHPFSALLPLNNWQLEHFIHGLPAGEEKTYSFKDFPYAYAGIEKPSRITAALLQSGEKRHCVFSSAA